MNEDKLNLSLRKFLKKLGINSQREIETAVRRAQETGQLSQKKSVKVTARVSMPEVGMEYLVEGEIELE